MTSLGNGQKGDFLRMHRILGQTLPAPRHHLLTMIHKMMCYISIQDAGFKLQYMKHSIKIYKTMIPLSMIFSTIVFIMNAVNQEDKRERRKLCRLFPDTCHVGPRLIKRLSFDIYNIPIIEKFRQLYNKLFEQVITTKLYL